MHLAATIFHFFFIFLFFGNVHAGATMSLHHPEIAPDIEKRLAQLPRTPIDYDKSLLDENEKLVVNKLVEATKYIDELFFTQVAQENLALREKLVEATESSPPHVLALQLFDAMKGKWDRVALNEPFVAPFREVGAKPPGAGFYPIDITKKEFDRWICDHPESKPSFQSAFTVITRQNSGLVAIPYSKYYAQYLEPAANKLREAANITKNQSLKNYLLKRAAAFASDDYYESDVAWMDLDSSIEVVVGPYEVYEDNLFNYKAAFESFITVVDKQESDKLKVYGAHLHDMEMNLPIPDQYKNPNRGFESPIRVVQEIFTGGDARKGVMTAAFNLPNDERVREAKGSKKVMLKNVMEAKFQKTGLPIAKRVLEPGQPLSFAAYFNHSLFHELSHGLGPGIIVGPDGKKNESRIYLKELYTTIEECKADVLGIWNILYAIDHQLLTAFNKETLYTTYTGLIFRMMRHGLDEAHGRGSAVQWLWLREKGGIVKTAAGYYKADSVKMYEGIKSLANELLMIEATGDYARAQTLLQNYGHATDEIKEVINKLTDIPVDITPVFVGVGEK